MTKTNHLFQFLLILFLFSLTSCFQPVQEEEVARNQQNCRELKLPASFEKYRETTIVKWAGTTVARQFYSTEEPNSVIEFFNRSMRDDGWSYSNQSDWAETKIRYVRDGYSVELHFNNISISNKRLYGVACVRRAE